MKKIIIFLLACFITCNVVSATYVRGHMTKNGTYVNGHYRSKANNTKLDNYSTKGNSNPYTGKKGSSNTYSYKKTHYKRTGSR